jgi:cell wall-associated NlpC family hydrolase
MRKKVWVKALLLSLFMISAGSIPARADTGNMQNIPIVPPMPFEALSGPSFSGKGPGVSGVSLGKGQDVANYAKQFLGNPYVYGGTSLTEGADCSGFVLSIYKQYGVNLPRTSEEQGKAGIEINGIENAKPGDLISYIGHIGIYGGDRKLIHASGPEDGIKISNVDFKPIQSIRRILSE